MSLVHGVSTVTKHGKWSYKSQKGTGHVFYMATPSHTTESVRVAFDENPTLLACKNILYPAPPKSITLQCSIPIWSELNVDGV